MHVPFIYEDNDVVVINKPAGLMVHGDGRSSEQTLADWVRETRPEIVGVGEPLTLTDGRVIDRPGIVHRLDKETSGVLVLAKTQESFLFLKQQFQGREVHKIYNAFVYGVLKNDAGEIDRPIGKSRSDFRLWSAQRGAKGVLREARTEYVVIERGTGHTFVEVRPQTGRTHQIRVHFKAINYPVVCDRLYAPKRPCELGFTRLALHARAIEVALLSGGVRRFEAPLPEDFVEALAALG